MKIKAKPEDFIVQEVAGMNLSRGIGRFRIYTLKKKQWDTLDLIGHIARKLGVKEADISVGGMKDRQGETEQLLGIVSKRGLPETLSEDNFSIRSLGYSDDKLNSKALSGNNFDIVIRDLAPSETDLFYSNFDEVKRFGVPNYFDEQRFGAARHGKGFMGKEIFLGHMEKALSLYLEPSRKDRKADKIFKISVMENWCKWEKSVSLAPPKYRKLIEYLSLRGNRHAFTGAFNQLDRRLVLLTLQSYQSYLWNGICARMVSEKSAAGGFRSVTYPFKYGDLVFYRALPESTFHALSGLRIDVPGYDSVYEDPQIARIASELLQKEGITLSDLKVKKLFHVRVKSVGRDFNVIPERFEVLDAGPDDMYPGKRKIRIGFFLKRGSYATLIIKRLFLVQAKGGTS
jgi:tRNA pseudouridine13 synthase